MPLSDLLLPAADPASHAAIPLICLTPASRAEGLAGLTEAQRRWAEAQGFEAREGQMLAVPAADGAAAAAVLFGLGAGASDPFLPGRMASLLPKGVYAFRTAASLPGAARLAALGWLLEAYRFTAYKSAPAPQAALVTPEGVDHAALLAAAEAVCLARDLVNTPACDMGPAELEAAIRTEAARAGAEVATIAGERLAAEFPMIHAVGKGSPRAPRLIDLTWGRPEHPRVTLVGKGVCFDTGGLDIKPASGMLLMKKDMGGAAATLALARLIMAAQLPVRLRLLVPAVENAVSGEAFRPGDVLKSRKGLSVEIGNTDAEGRLVLADALALADEEAPDLLIDMATLTGAARVALGPDLPPFYTDDEEAAAALARHAAAENDPLWRLPFWSPYDKMLDSRIADLNNVSDAPFAGSVTAALFLRRFVARARSFIHLDVFAWTPAAKPGRPAGGEGQAIRALFAMIKARYQT